MFIVLLVSIPSPLYPLVRTQIAPPLMFMLPSALMPLGDDVSLLLLYCPPSVTMYTFPPVKYASVSTFMPLPPLPVLFSHSSPAFMVNAESALMHAAPFASLSSVSYVPPPVVITVVRPPLTITLLSQFMPLAASADTSTLIMPPLMNIPSLALMP